MNGTIVFENEEALANFLNAFCPSSAVFKCHYDGMNYVLTFTGGY